MAVKLSALFILVAVLFTSNHAAIKNCYISVPHTFKPGVASTIQFELSTPPNSSISVNVSIYNYPSYANIIYSVVQNVSKQKDAINITLPVDTPEDIYYLYVTSSIPSIIPITWSYMIVKHGDNFLFVETDKPVYRRGETVQIRVFATTPNLLPVLSDVVVEYWNPSNDLFARLINVAATPNGLFKTVFNLSPRAAIGDWTILVYSKNSDSQLLNYKWEPVKGKRVFTVYDYDTPHFDLSVKFPQSLSKGDRWINGTIEARQRSGKSVIGRVQITLRYTGAKVDGSDGLFEQSGQFGINGNTNFSMQFTQGIALSNKQVLMNITLNEFQTDMFYTKLISIPFFEAALSIKPAIPNSNYIVPGKQFIQKFVITRRDGTALSTISGLQMKYSIDAGTSQLADITFGQDLKPSLSIATLSTTKSIQFLEVDYNKMPVDGAELPASVGNLKTPAYVVEIKQSTDDIVAGGDAKFTITMIESVPRINYVVVSKGVIRSSARDITVTGNGMILTIGITNEMIPYSRLVVYYWSDAVGDIIANQIRFEVKGNVVNTVRLSFSSPVMEGGTDVVLSVTAKPNSLVALSIINADLLLLKSKSDNFANDLVDVVSRWERASNITFQDKTAADVYFESGLAFFRDLPMKAYQTSRKRSIREAPSVQDLPIISPPDIEVLYWNEITVGSDGLYNLTIPIPVHLRNASYVANAYAINPKDGFGPAESTVRLDVVPKMYTITLNAPSTVARYNLFLLQVAIINRSPSNIQQLTFDLTKSDNFDIAISDGTTSTATTYNVQRKNLDASYDMAITFPLQAKKIGSITLAVQVSFEIDGGKKSFTNQINIFVKPEGIEDTISMPIVLNMQTQQTFTKNVIVSTPTDMVPDSGRVTLNAFLYPMEHSAMNLENLIVLPWGCGEQNLMTLTPVIYISLYLQSVGKFTEPVKSKAISYMTYGYQSELNFRSSEGGISVWNGLPTSGWLTAFSLRSFMIAQQFICIDLDIMTGMMKYIIGRQQTDGSFLDSYQVYHYEMQSGTRGGIGLSAFFLIALVEKKNTLAPATVISKATKYLEGQQSSAFNNPYTVAIVTYALHLVNSSDKNIWFTELERLAHKDDNAGIKYWDTNWYNSRVEATGYALLTYMLRGLKNEALPLVTWLLQNRNVYGAWYSTPDTSIGLQALSAYYNGYKSDTVMRIKVSAPSDFQFDLNGEIIPIELDYIPSSIGIEATGRGIAVLQISVFFNRQPPASKRVGKRDTEALPEITTTVVSVTPNNITVRTCIKFVSSEVLSMTVVQIPVPAGFNVTQSLIEKFLTNTTLRAMNLSYVELAKNSLNLYFDTLDATERCVDIFFDRFENVQVPEHIYATVIDYYRPVRKAYAQTQVNATCTTVPEQNYTCITCPNNTCSSITNNATYSSYTPSALNTSYTTISTVSPTTSSGRSNARCSVLILIAGLFLLVSIIPVTV